VSLISIHQMCVDSIEHIWYVFIQKKYFKHIDILIEYVVVRQIFLMLRQPQSQNCWF